MASNSFTVSEAVVVSFCCCCVFPALVTANQEPRTAAAIKVKATAAQFSQLTTVFLYPQQSNAAVLHGSEWLASNRSFVRSLPVA